jgi:hypothetical protein
VARGLLEDDNKWRLCFAEAAHMQTGYGLRQLFVTTLIFCNITDPLALWNEFSISMCDDLSPRVAAIMGCEPRVVTQAQRTDFGLFLIGELLSNSGYTLHQFALPSPQRAWAEIVPNVHIAHHAQYDPAIELLAAEEGEKRLNAEQANAYQQVVASVERLEGKVFFLNGAGGTGKTTVYKTICNRVRAQQRIVLCVASSGIAALLLPGGRTAHSTFKIPIEGLTGETVCAINKESNLASLLRVAELIVWDEITQQHKHAFEAVDRTLRDIRDVDRPFGGMTVVFGGDFQQTLPVVPRGRREDIVGATIQSSPLWQNVILLRLQQNMRLQRGDGTAAFAEWLLDVGHGKNLPADGNIDLPPRLRSDSLANLIDFIYPNVNSSSPPPPEYFAQRTILCPRNTSVDDINHSILDRMSGQQHTFMSADAVLKEDGTVDSNPEIPAEFLRTLQLSGLPPGELRIKDGCPLILLRNLAANDGLCNGTRMVVVRASARVIEVKLMGGSHDGMRHLIPRIVINPSSSQGHFSFAMRRRQFPVRLAFAMTINKAQGQSVNWVGIDLRVPVFSHGQLYVALSRATSSDRIRVLFPDDEPGTRTLNIVYPEVLVD